MTSAISQLRSLVKQGAPVPVDLWVAARKEFGNLTQDFERLHAKHELSRSQPSVAVRPPPSV